MQQDGEGNAKEGDEEGIGELLLLLFGLLVGAGGVGVAEDGDLVVGFGQVDEKGEEQEDHGGKGQKDVLVAGQDVGVPHPGCPDVQQHAHDEGQSRQNLLQHSPCFI